MSSKRYSFYWTIISILALAAVIVLLVATYSAAQALDGEQVNQLQTTPVPPTVGLPTIVVPTVVVTTVPGVTVVAPTAVIPNTGGTTVIVDFFSNWLLWAVLGILVILLLIALAGRPSGPDIHYHEDL